MSGRGSCSHSPSIESDRQGGSGGLNLEPGIDLQRGRLEVNESSVGWPKENLEFLEEEKAREAHRHVLPIDELLHSSSFDLALQAGFDLGVAKEELQERNAIVTCEGRE